MNCREAQDRIFAERDSALDNSQRVALEGHVTHCEDCRRIRESLMAALTAWRLESDRSVVPDVEREWHAVRRRIRGGVDDVQERRTSRRSPLSWLAVPLAATAALALAFFITPGGPGPAEGRAKLQVARADSVEVPGNNASTMVFVDEKSGWLIVWASDAPKSL